MDWRNWIVTGYRGEGRHATPRFSDGATDERLATLEREVGMQLPAALRELLQQTDGMLEMLDGEPFFVALWSCDQIAKKNESIRADPEGPSPAPGAPETTPLYFADAGADGIVFALLVRPSGEEDPGVHAYYPIENEWRLISPTLAAHARGWVV